MDTTFRIYRLFSLGLLLLVFSLLTTVSAHSLVYSILSDGTQASSVLFAYSGASKDVPKNATYRIYAPGELEHSYQNGIVDPYGRVVFLPDRPGEWRVEALDDEGNTVAAKLEVSAEMVVKSSPRWGRWLLLLSVILNISLVLYIMQLRDKKNAIQS